MLHGYLDLPTFTFFKEKNIWTGSIFQNLNYRIMSKTSDDDIKQLYAVIWLGEKCFDLTNSNEYIVEFYEEFSPDGLKKIIENLNQKADKYKKNNGRF